MEGEKMGQQFIAKLSHAPTAMRCTELLLVIAAYLHSYLHSAFTRSLLGDSPRCWSGSQTDPHFASCCHPKRANATHDTRVHTDTWTPHQGGRKPYRKTKKVREEGGGRREGGRREEGGGRREGGGRKEEEGRREEGGSRKGGGRREEGGGREEEGGRREGGRREGGGRGREGGLKHRGYSKVLVRQGI